MILVIRISGMINIPSEVNETLHRIRLRRKYAAVLLNNTKENLKILKLLRNYVAFGEINQETLKKLIKERAMPKDSKTKIDADKVAEGLDKKSLGDLGVKPFFRLHPPRGGIDAKKHFGVAKGVLGDNKEKINELVRRML
ncbi:MAG: uL30 family ribosomal protein [Nanoarchaeota archaeon]|nr:uL30 family ribosomal protein [Nanoarchaeota archaeon]